MPDRILVWDFDGTLATRIGGWSGTVYELLKSVGHSPIDPATIGPHLRTGFPWHSPDTMRQPGADDEWWAGLRPKLVSVFQAAGVDGALAGTLAAQVRACYTDASRWHVFADTFPVLDELKDRGWRHVMLSNHVPELERLVEDLGLRPRFDAIYNSARTGIEKPNFLAFEAVFADFPAAREGWMIGDNVKADVGGASRAGMRAILVRRRAEAPIFCETLHETIAVVQEAVEA